MELSSAGTLSTLTQEGWPLGIGVRFAVDSQGTPVLSLKFSVEKRSALHVQNRTSEDDNNPEPRNITHVRALVHRPLSQCPALSPPSSSTTSFGALPFKFPVHG